MDPNATFDAMMTAVRAEDWPAAREHARNLRDWLVRGGFPPDRPHAGDWLLTVLGTRECIHAGVFATDQPTTYCGGCGRDVPQHEL